MAANAIRAAQKPAPAVAAVTVHDAAAAAVAGAAARGANADHHANAVAQAVAATAATHPAIVHQTVAVVYPPAGAAVAAVAGLTAAGLTAAVAVRHPLPYAHGAHANEPGRRPLVGSSYFLAFLTHVYI